MGWFLRPNVGNYTAGYPTLLTANVSWDLTGRISWDKTPYYPALHFKRVHSTRPIYSVRISIDYRALGILQDNEIIWFWIGSHTEYDKAVKQQRQS